MVYQQLRLDQVTVAATGFKGPEGVTVDREGNVYEGGTDGVIRKLSPDGKVIRSMIADKVAIDGPRTPSSDPQRVWLSLVIR